MTDPNQVHGAQGGWPQPQYPQTPPPQVAHYPQTPQPQAEYPQTPQPQSYDARHPYQAQQAYDPQQAYAPEPEALQGHAAHPYAPGPGHAPAPYGQQPLPPVDDAAATTLLPPVPAMDDAGATTLLPPVVVSGPAPGGAPAPAPGQAPAQAFDPPTMTLKRPVPAGGHAPQAPAAPYPAVPPPGAVPAQPGPVASPAPAARTGSPIIDPGLQPALITAGAAALLAGGAALGQVGLALALAPLQALTAAGWFRLNGMWPARQGIALAALAGLTADAAVLLADANGGAAAVVGTLGGFFLLVMVLQTFRPADPKERFYALTVLGSATVVTVLCTALLLADWVPAAVGAVALATVLAAAPLPGPKQLGPVLGLVAAVVLGLAVGAPPALGALAGLGALVGRRVAGYDFPSRFVHMTAGVALPLAVAAPLVWIATRLLAG
ncbi:hypothetical protein RMN57_21915 [Kitasatospora sp. CM 4170]|uniref:Integral membrane protein n=1 Tax=Kitasatospora aburaviensis TaxID=67265 RepID=A0ABW1F6P6_9ACTN|nr:hypothetical protein [Kitasatospora sp. CM 4170]WNM47167.1 hypothetical protein RMN57_21915 [Kitasatospora sp. CM 4170]